MILLDTATMARFVADGYLRLDGIVPDEINQRFLDELGRPETAEPMGIRQYYRALMASGRVPIIPAGTPLAEAYAPGSVLAELLDLPEVAGAVASLVGANPMFDHHFLHVTFPEAYHGGRQNVSQHYHQDSTIDPRTAFDIQIMYFPHAVTREMGGTRFLPGSHLRVVSEASIGRYQNIVGQQHMVCEAGTLLFLHMGIWHGGGLNVSDQLRYMFKIRINPVERQERLWDDSDLPANDDQRPIFWVDPISTGPSIHEILMTPQPWYEADAGRLEMMNRIRLWRYLTGDDSVDVDYWLTRVENELA